LEGNKKSKLQSFNYWNLEFKNIGILDLKLSEFEIKNIGILMIKLPHHILSKHFSMKFSNRLKVCEYR